MPASSEVAYENDPSTQPLLYPHPRNENGGDYLQNHIINLE